MGRLFGTDGVRGIAGTDLTARLATDLAAAAAHTLGEAGAFAAARAAGRRPLALVGRDPRASGEFLEAAVVAGLAGAGVDVVRLGVVPTPAVAYLTADLGEFGVMLSASHNPAPDNGIKFFGRGGLKLPDDVEDEIEDKIRRRGSGPAEPPECGFGRVTDASAERERYLDHLVSSVPAAGATGRDAGARGRPPLSGLRVVVDCAHGAAYQIAPEALRRAGADVVAIGADPDGLNINQGSGSTSLSALSAAVVAHQAD